MADDDLPDGQGPQSNEISDLIGIEVTLAVAVWFVVTLVAFFFVGVVVGMLLVVAGAIGFGWAFLAAIRRADTSA